jgi:hypothetical protein
MVSRSLWTVLPAAAVTVAAALIAAGPPAVAAARPAATAGTWAKAEEVPGTGTKNTGGFADIESVSCGSAGNCSAGGYYTHGNDQDAFIANETNGTWGRAREIAAALNTGGGAQVTSVWCASAGNCSAGGDYEAAGRSQAFVVREVNGTWGKAEEVAGALNRGIGAGITSVSCASAGNCGAGGYYTDGSGHTQAFVVSETDSTWGKAEEVPGTAALNKGGSARINAVSCAAAGTCSVGGDYSSRYNSHTGVYTSQAFVVTESHGTWGTAEEVPGTAALNKGGSAGISSVSCWAAGDCSAGGSYANTPDGLQAFVVSETGGTWGTAKEVPGTAALNRGADAFVNSVSCAAAGDCSAGGLYAPGNAGGEAFVVSETGGTWGTAKEVPGTAALNKGGLAALTSVSCASAGNCSAGGYYTDGSANQQALVVGETNGSWHSAEELPGSGALNQGSNFGQGRAAVESVSCPSAGHCGAGGEYVDGNAAQQAMLDSES